MSHLPYDTFRETLATKYPNCGHALWEPSSGGLYDAVEVGDVGFIREGCFHRLFNVFLPGDHPSHQNFGVPEYHQQLHLNASKHIHKGIDGTNDFCSRHVTLTSHERDIHALGPDDDSYITASCPGRRGAVLSLPIPAQREDTVARGDFGRWITKHIDLWFAFAQNLGLGVDRMQDIILVTGRHCTKSWVNVAFSEGQRDAEVSFGVRVSGRSGVSIERRLVRGDAVLKLGPSSEDLPENQCIFVRGYRMVRILNIWPRLRGQAGPSPHIGGHDSEPEPEPDKQLEPIGALEDTNYQDPLHTLLQYIAEKAPNCDLALVHDDDLACIDGASLDSLQPDTLIEHLRSSAREIRQVRFDYLPGNESGTGAVAVAKIATLSKHEFALAPALSDVQSTEEGRIRKKHTKKHKRHNVAGSPDEIRRPATPKTPVSVVPLTPNKQVIAVEAQQDALEVVSPLRRKSTDLSGKVSRVSEDVFIEGRILDFYVGAWTLDGDYATLGRPRDQSPASKRRFKDRIEVWLGLHHRNLLSFFGHAEIGGVVYSVSPWMNNENIREYLQRNPSADRTRLLCEVASGVEFLHENGVIHGDLCGKNVSINEDGKALVCGFDLSSFATPTSNTTRARWLAPEQQVTPTAVTEKADIWSFGSLCIEVFTGKDPYSLYSDLKVPVLLSEGTTPELPGSMAIGLSQNMRELMRSCWKFNPAERPSISTVHLTISGILIPRSPRPWVSLPRKTWAPVELSEPKHPTGSHPTLVGVSKGVAPQSPPLSPSTHIFSPRSRPWVPVNSEVLVLMDRVASDTRCSLRSAEDGTVIAGNLEGLVTRVVTSTGNLLRDDHFNAVFLTTYQLFATSKRVLEILKRQFETTNRNSKVPFRRKHSILLFMENWLKKGFDDEDLSCSLMIKEFALAISGPRKVKEKAVEIAGLVDDFDNICIRKPISSTWTLRKPARRPPGVRPSDLAVALTAVEGEQFKRVTYWDYVNFIRQRPNARRIEMLYTIHDKVTQWVQKSVMDSDHLEERMKTYEEWIYTAQLCRSMNNFSSASAIVAALKLPMVTALVLTCESKANQILHILDRDLTPTNGAYYDTLRQAETKNLIPWLDPHLSNLNTTFTSSNPIVEEDGHFMINFKLCRELAEQIDSVAQYSPPPHAHSEARRDVMEYVEYSLQSSTGGDAAAEARSVELAEDERSMSTQREATQALGRPWLPYKDWLDMAPKPGEPENQGNDRFGYTPLAPAPPLKGILKTGPKGVIPGRTFPGPPAHQAPSSSQPAVEGLQKLSSRSLHHPGSRVDTVAKEPGPPGRTKVYEDLL